MRTAYTAAWTGIDSGREGLWREPIWSGVLSIIALHTGELVYDPQAAVYEELERAFPNEKWRSQTASGHFRPLFRDYPNAWTRTALISLADRKFALTPLGVQYLNGGTTRAKVLSRMFCTHVEAPQAGEGSVRPFAVLASAFLEANRPFTTVESYWGVMKGYRPKCDDFVARLKSIPHVPPPVEATAYRRLNNMLTLLRAAGAIQSHRLRTATLWSTLDVNMLQTIAREPKS